MTLMIPTMRFTFGYVCFRTIEVAGLHDGLFDVMKSAAFTNQKPIDSYILGFPLHPEIVTPRFFTLQVGLLW